MFKYFTTIVLAFCFLSCGFNDKLPEGFPKREQFAQILADVHFSDAVIAEVRVKKRKIDTAANGYYHDVLVKHNLTQEKFDTVVSWYASHPELYKEVYEDVVTLLIEKEAKWQHEVKGVKEEMERLKKEKEARNIWVGNKKIIQVSNKDTFDRELPFNIGVDTIMESGYRISAFYQCLKGNMVKELSLEVVAMYADSSYDTVSYNIPESFNRKKVEVNIGIDDSLNILRLQGYLLKHDTNEVIKVRVKNVEFEYLPKEDSMRIE